jgi:ketol-acid reductoisomerase
VLKDEVVAVIGYGGARTMEALNQKENGVNVIIGQRKNSRSWRRLSAMVSFLVNPYLKLKRHSNVVP